MAIYQNSTHNWLNVGRLTQAPVLSVTPQGKPATNLSLALNVVNPNAQNEQDRTKTKYLNISVYGELATIICEKVKLGKGDMVQVSLEFISRQKVLDGKNFNYIELVLDSFTLLSRAEANRQQYAPQQGGYNQAPAQPAYNNAPQQGGYNQAPAQPAYNNAPQQGGYNQAPAQPAYNQAPQQGAYNQAPAQPAYNQAPRGMEQAMDFDDDIPF